MNILTLILAVSGIIRLDGAYTRQLQPRDSILIADQIEYGVRIEGVADGTAFAFPEWPDSLVAPLEAVTPWRLDTLSTKGRKAGAIRDLQVSRTITTFDEGTYELPPISLLRKLPDGTIDTLVFNSPTIEVCTMPVDTATFEINDIKGQIRYPITFREILPWIIAALTILGFIWLAATLLRRRREAEAGKTAEPAHIVALRKLDRFRGDKYWEPDKQKAFYSGITDALREYIVARYGVEAMEMTTAEIFQDLKVTDIPADIYEEMKDLFERADFVKFAKHTATREENASALPSAVRFVTSTYQHQLDEESAGTEKEAE